MEVLVLGDGGSCDVLPRDGLLQFSVLGSDAKNRVVPLSALGKGGPICLKFPQENAAQHGNLQVKVLQPTHAGRLSCAAGEFRYTLPLDSIGGAEGSAKAEIDPLQRAGPSRQRLRMRS
ncbi:unnamed protein product [Polarella glacialis]|uniref:Uncharacterized protein n=1 Tax=Polarella glacialis TaxID=89957 RepID=A0A813IMB6_POLGL|nr:unnamed protein product [Polarella glacialis]